MVPLTMLWLPIVVSAVLVFIASSIIWMMTPIHKNDYQQLPDENPLLDAMASRNVGPGQYMFPFMKPGDRSPEVMKRFEEGPSGIMVVRKPGPHSMGKQLFLWFLYLVGNSILVAYLVGHTLPSGSDYLEVFRVSGTAAILAYAAAHFQAGIWFSKPWNVVIKDILDGVVYGLLTAGAFGWLYPAA